MRTQELYRRNSSTSLRQPKVLHPIENGDLRILGWRVDHHKQAMNEDELVERIGQYHVIGIRSKTKITERVIKAAPKVPIR